MKLFSASLFALLALSAQGALAASSWAGANNYYAFNLPDDDRHTLLDAMQSAGMKVLRTFVGGLPSNVKNSGNPGVPDLEADGFGQWNDKVLTQIDQLMVDAQARGIKLLIAMHGGENSLDGSSQNGVKDVYGSQYGSQGFYTNEAAIEHFNTRITHILNGHNNTLVDGKPWSELSDYIFGFEAQNEPMIKEPSSFYQENLSWICKTASQIRSNVGNKDQLILTGGGNAGASVQSYFFGSSCADIDVVAIHDYTDGYDSYMKSAVSSAQSAGKKLLVEEWGSTYSSDDSSRISNMKSNVDKINSYGVPWMYWEPIPGADPHQEEDFEIQVNGGNDWTTLVSSAKDTAKISSPFDFSASLPPS